MCANNLKSENLVCKLVKSLYGLKQAPRCWSSKLLIILKEVGYVQSRAYYSIFKKVEKSVITIILVYVDDLLIVGNSDANNILLKLVLSETFYMKHLGEVKYF